MIQVYYILYLCSHWPLFRETSRIESGQMKTLNNVNRFSHWPFSREKTRKIEYSYLNALNKYTAGRQWLFETKRLVEEGVASSHIKVLNTRSHWPISGET